MTRAGRTIAWLARGVIGLLILLLIGLWVLFATTSGSRLAVSQLVSLMDGNLAIERVEGALAGPLTVYGVRFENEVMTVELEQASLDWLPTVFLFSQALIHVEQLHLQGLRMVMADKTADTNVSQPPKSALPGPLLLPVAMRIDDFALTQAALLQRSEVTTELVDVVQFERITATNLRWDDEGIDLPQIMVKTAEVDLQANGHLNPEDNWPLHLDASYSVDMTKLELADVSGHTRVEGSLVHLDFSQQLDPPYALQGQGSVSDPLTSPQWQVELQSINTQLNVLRVGLPAVALNADITAQGNATQASLTAQLRVAQTVLQVSGDLIFAAEANSKPAVDLKLAWQNLVWPLDVGQPSVFTSHTGRALVSGQLDSYSANIDAQAALPGYPEGGINVAGTGSATEFDVQKFELALLGGRVQGTAKAAWENGLSSSFDLSGTTLDPAGILPGWPGQINFSVQGDAVLAPDAKPENALINLTNLQLDGVLRDKPVSIKAAGKYADAELVLPSLFVTTLGTTLQAQGTVALTETGQTDFLWQFSMDDLSLWKSGSEGAVQARGHLTGTLREPRLQASLTANNIAVEAVQIDHAEVSADLGLDPTPLALNAVIDVVQFADTQLSRVELDLKGSKTNHNLSLHVENDAGTSDMTLSGSLSALPEGGAAAPLADWENVAWQVSVVDLGVNQDELSVDLLPANEDLASTATVGSGAFTLNTTCFRFSGLAKQKSDAGGIQRLCTRAAGAYADNIAGQVTLDNLSLSVLDGLLPDDMNLLGRVNGTLSAGVNIAAGTAQADLSLSTNATALETIDSNGVKQTLVRFAPGKLVGNWQNDILTAEIDLPQAGGGGLDARVNLAAGEGKAFSTRALDANIAAKFSDLDWLADFVPGVSQLEGEFVSDIRLDGTVAAPNLTGDLMLTGGKATLPEPGLTLRDISVTLRGGGNNDLTLVGSARSGRGEMSLAGQLQDLGRVKDMTGDIRITGKRFLILNTPEAEIISSPDVTAQLKQGHLDIAGDILIDKADIQLKSLPQTAASVSDDQIIVTSESAPVEPGDTLNVTTRIRLLLNDAVVFEGFGLESKFTGVLNILDTPDEPVTATGEIEVVEGRYQAYGQDLTIEKGKLLFVGGPIDQPGIDVRAVRQATADIKVGVIVRGSLRAPEFSIFSQPSMSQSDQLAYLVLGRPLGEGTSSESSALSRAALVLGIQGGNYLSEQIGDKLGVDTIGIETPAGESNEQAALVVGKYLSPKLYVSYGIGILDALDTLKIEYILSSKWRLTSESSIERGGADLTYTLER